MFKSFASLSFLALAQYVVAHGDHQHAGPAPGENIQQYAQRHMSSEHHIDSFDTASFFQLHDLNRDGVWDKGEIEAVYGVHHVYSQKKSKDQIEHQQKADQIVESVLRILDLNKDGVIQLEELEQVGLSGLPNFENLGAEGHHYDVESEFFLHHEEQFHSTPETQTDESYSHPEDIEHFAHHEKIELEEVEREAKFAGLSVEEVLDAINKAQAAAKQQADNVQQPMNTNPQETSDHPKVTRIPPPEKQDPATRYAQEKPVADEWGTGEKGYKAPKAPADRMRKNVPYKYKIRRNWGDF